MRFRIRFEKRGSIRFTSHRDVLRMVQRCLAAARIPVSFSQGYHPHMRMSFGPPLKTGWEGYDEYMDVQLEERIDSIAERCNAFLPDGLRWTAFAEVADTTPKLANDITAAKYEVRVRRDEMDEEAVARARNETPTPFNGADDTSGKPPEVVDVSIQPVDDDLCIEYTSTMLSGRIVPPLDVIASIGATDGLRTPLRVARSAQYVARDGEYVSPLNTRVIQGTP